MEKNKLKKKVEVIAEIANAHQGSAKIAYKLACAFHAAGADAVKLQIYFADELLSINHPRYSHFKKQSFSVKIWNKLINDIKKKKIKIYCDVFGVKAFEVANNNNVDGFKIHSSDLNNLQLINLIKKTNKKIFLSTGGSTISEVAYAVKLLTNQNRKPILLHGFQSYPTKISNCDISKIQVLKKIFQNKCQYGYQDHVSAEDNFNYVSPILAINQGAEYIEKHVTFNRSKKGVDYYSSLEPQEFKNFLLMIKNYEKSFIKSNFSFFTDEIKYRQEVKKIWFSKRKLKKGHKVKLNDLIMKRPKSNEINPISVNKIIGKKLIKDLDIETPVNKSYLQNHVTAIIVARSKSTRLPNKATKKICGITTLEHLIGRIKKSKKINKIILCTTNKNEDNKLIKIAKKNNIEYFKGPTDNVLQRMVESIKKIKTDLIVRVTGDDILIDPTYLDLTIESHLTKNLEYSNNKKLPSGTEVELFDKELLNSIYVLAKDSSGTEYLTFYIDRYKNQFATGTYEVLKKHQKKIRLTIDTPKDFKVVSNFLNKMKKKGKLFNYDMDDICNFERKNKKLFKQRKITNKKIQVNTDFQWEKII